MNSRKITALLVCAFALLVIAGTKVSQLTRTRSLQSTSRFMVSTQDASSGRWSSRYITAPDLATNIGPWITNSGGGASSVTNAISVVRSNGTAISSAATSLDFIEGTNVTIRATNAAGVVTVQINASGGGSVDPTNAVLANIIATGAMTNNWNSWVIYGSPTVSNSMFAVNRGLGIVTNSTSFSGLMQSIVNRGVEGFHIEIMPNPYYSNSYSADATITITNWGIIQGHGNPVTVIRGTAALNGPIFQVGTTNGGAGGVPIGSGGINRFKDIRLEGDNAGVNGVGIKIVNSAEPVFRDMETTGFKLAGIELASTQYVHWAYADHCWFVTKNAGAVGILVSEAPASADRAFNHFDINDCNFGTFGGGEAINVLSNFPNFRVTDSVFKYASGTMNYGINQLNGRDAYYSGNKFINFGSVTPITFAGSGGLYTGVTNLNPTFVNNHSDGTGEIITLGQFVTNVTMGGNSIRGSGPTVLYEDVASNGRINNLDPTELRLGHLTTNTIPYIGAYGEVKTATLSGLTLSGGTLTASAGGSLATNANQFGASVTLTIKDGALLTNTSIRTALTLPTLTVSRAAVLNSTGQLTNSAAVSDVEIEYLDGVTSAIQTQLNGKQNGQTNSSQFGASTVLTLADRLSVTNLNSYGTGAVFFGHVTVSSNITASSFIGSGTGTPILKLQTMMAADNAFAISVRTNFTQSTTNFFEVTNASAGQAMVVHSASAGQVVWTNGAAASVYTLGGALVATAVPSSAGILVATGFTLHPTVNGLQQNGSGAATAPLGRLYFHQNVVISHINLNGSSQIQTTTNLALMLMTNGIAATNMTAVLVGNDSRYVATNTTDTVTLLAGSYLTMLMTNNAAIPSANWVWSFKVTPQ